jgi:hypothetical protein
LFAPVFVKPTCRWSSQLGALAAGLQTGKPQTDFAQVGFEADPAASTRLAGLLARHLHRNSPQQQAAHKLKANLFMAGFDGPLPSPVVRLKGIKYSKQAAVVATGLKCCCCCLVEAVFAQDRASAESEAQQQQFSPGGKAGLPYNGIKPPRLP